MTNTDWNSSSVCAGETRDLHSGEFNPAVGMEGLRGEEGSGRPSQVQSWFWYQFVTRQCSCSASIPLFGRVFTDLCWELFR